MPLCKASHGFPGKDGAKEVTLLLKDAIQPSQRQQRLVELLRRSGVQSIGGCGGNGAGTKA